MIDNPTDQTSLPFQRMSPTSRTAALHHAPRAGTQRGRVLEWFVRNGPATDDDCQAALGMLDRSERPRRGELVRGGWLERHDDAGQTPSGNQASRWIATTKGLCWQQEQRHG